MSVPKWSALKNWIRKVLANKNKISDYCLPRGGHIHARVEKKAWLPSQLYYGSM